MKIYLRFIFIFILTFTFGAGRALAEEKAYKTLDFATKPYDKSINSYKLTWTATVGTDKWTIANFSNYSKNWPYIKCGYDDDASIAYIKNSNAFDKAITKVVVTIDAIVETSVNSISLYVYSDANCKKIVETLKATTKTTGETSFVITSPSASYYYMLEFNCKKGSKNGLVQVSKVIYYADVNTTTTTFSGVTNNTLNVTQGYSFTSPTASVKTGTETLAEATVTYSSSNTDVATVDSSNGTLTITGAGTATITAKYKGDDTYGDSSASYTLVVSDHKTDTFNPTDTKGKGTIETGGTIKAEKTAVKLETNRGYGDTDFLKIYGKNIYNDTPIITFTAKEGYAISGITLTANSEDYIQTWKDGNDKELTINKATATWSGFATSVTITNLGTSMAQLTSIAVDYVKFNESGTITISESGKGTYCPTVNCIIGDGTVTKYITGTESNGTTLTEQDAPIVAAGEGVLLNGKAGTYKVYTHDKLTATKNSSNKLVGCTEETSKVPQGCYVMQKHNDVVAFYIVNSDNFTASKGKAYLDLGTSNTSGAKALFFNSEETTGIFSPAVEEEVSAQENIYTLSGTKVDKANMKKGIYIVNGKKYVVK